MYILNVFHNKCMIPNSYKCIKKWYECIIPNSNECIVLNSNEYRMHSTK